MANVRNLFFPLFAYGLAFEQKNGPGQPQQSYAQVRRELSALWDTLHTAALERGMGETDFLNAAFAAVAWIDETILKHPTWEHRNQWRIAPLQLHYYKTRRANETFFERLAQLRPEQTELREIYYMCLRQGFTGQYSRDIEAIHELADRIVSQPPVNDGKVSPPPGDNKEGPDKPPVRRSFTEWVKILRMRALMPLQTLSQHVARFGKKGINSIKRPMRQPLEALIQRLRAHWLLKAGLGLLAIVLLVLFVLWWSPLPKQFQLTVDTGGNGSGTLIASPAPDRICSPPDCAKTTYTYAKGTVVTLQATADSTNSTFEKWKEADCAQVMTLTANKTCTAIFKPLVETTQPMRQPCAKVIDISLQSSHVAEEILGIKKPRTGVGTVDDPLQIIRSSFCDILDIIAPFQDGLKTDFGLVVSLDNKDAGPNPIYTNGQDLHVKVTTKFKSYIYVDYYAVDGHVVHLFPNNWEQGKPFVPRSELLEIRPILEPFGLELVTVIASKTPLFPSQRPDLENAREYNKKLQDIWPKVVSTSEIATTFHFITTQGQ